MFDGRDPWGSNFGRNNKTHGGGGKRPEDGLEKIVMAACRKVGDFFKKNNSKRKYRFFIVVLVTFLLLYMSSGFYIVQPEEEAVELVFGKYLSTTDPGLRYNFPVPIGQVIIVKVKTVNREEVGSGNGASEHGEGVMLTGDENIVNVTFDVQWKISNSYDYLFHLRDSRAGATVKNAAESAMREVIGRNSIAFAIEGRGRAVISQDTKMLLQSILDHYNMGVEILSIQLKAVDPPGKVINAFRDVQSARADKERVINEATAYRNDIIPRAKGEAIKIKMESEAYSHEVIELAAGNAERFLLVYNEYKKQPKAVRQRMYIESMEKVIGGIQDKTIVSDGISPFAYLPLDAKGSVGGSK